MGLAGLGEESLGPRKKNPINNWVGFGSQVQALGLSSGMQKPGPNPTRCHS